MRYFMYCRKSSENEDRQVASIESQLTTLQRTFSNRTDIEIVAIYEEAFSAKAPGRPKFDQMVARIQKKEAEGIIAWAPDRLARNSIDGGRLVYMLDRGVLRDLKFATYTFENNSQGKFMLQIMFGQSKYYYDALSDNVKRGNRTKVEKGWRPCRPPIGYISDPTTKTIIKDPERFERVRQIFDLMLTGTYSTTQIWKIATVDWDLRTIRQRTIGGRLIALCYVHRILTNPFYAGILSWNGQTYPGKHEPAVSMEEFDRVQMLLGRGGKLRPKKRSFAYTGLIRCGECGYHVTAEERENRYGSHYTYYHCTKRRTDYRCQQPFIQKRSLEVQIERFLEVLTMPENLHNWAVKHISTGHEAERQGIEERRSTLQEAQERTKCSLDNLTSLRIRDLIKDDEFLRERRKLEMEQLRLHQQQENLHETVPAFEPLESLISFRIRAIEWFREGDDATKRLILKTVGSNLLLKDKLVSVEAKKPFRFSVDATSYLQLRAVRDDVRTLWRNRDPELVEILANIQALEVKFGARPGPDRLQAA
jgi:site-specific DNA recombinase